MSLSRGLSTAFGLNPARFGCDLVALWPSRGRSGELCPSRRVLIGIRLAPGILDGLSLTEPFVEAASLGPFIMVEDVGLRYIAVGVLLRGGGGAPLIVPVLLCGCDAGARLALLGASRGA